MEWVDEARRKAFEKIVARNDKGFRKADELERFLPQQTVERSIALGNERILPYDDALAAIAIASEHVIAVLGFDVGEVQEDGFQVVDYSGYDRDVEFSGDWNSFVMAMNARAETWMKTHRYGQNYGYILTSTSEREFQQLGSPMNRRESAEQ